MIGIKECALSTMPVVLEVLKDPRALCQDAMSPRTQLVLQVTSLLTNSERRPLSTEHARRISNLIYTANSYFDIGLAALAQIYKNRHSQFVALETVYRETRDALETARAELLECCPDASPVVQAFIEDGKMLHQVRDQIDPATYAEIDSGIFAMLIFGVTCDHDLPSQTGLNPTASCHSLEDLKTKYLLFCPSQIDPDSIDPKSKQALIIGFQAIEMMLAVIDDRWGHEEDTLLGIPNTAGTADDSLIRHYQEIALKCGFSKALLNTILGLLYTHKLKVNGQRKEEPIELHEIQKHKHIGKIYLLREWLHSHKLLSEMFRT